MTSLRKKSVKTESKIKSKREIIKDLMIKHQDLFDKEGVTNPKFIPRLCYLHKGEKIISFYPSEMNGKQDIYTEFCDRDLVPEDPERTLYKWIYNESYKEEYEASKPHPVTGDIRYFIPVDELVIVKDLHKTEIKAYPIEEEDDDALPESELIDSRDASYASMTLRDYAAIQWRKPVSHKAWLNDLIKENQ